MMLNKNLDLEFLASENERLIQIVDNYNKGIVINPKTSISVGVEIDPNIIYDDDDDDNLFFSDQKGRVIKVSYISLSHLLQCEATLILNFEGLQAENIKINIISASSICCEPNILAINKLYHNNNNNGVFQKQLNYKLYVDSYPTTNIVKVNISYILKSKRN